MPTDFKLVVLISGSGSNLQSIIDHIDDGLLDAKIVAVISNKDDAFGLERAKNAGINALVLNDRKYSIKDYNKALSQKVESFNPDLIVLAGYMKILQPDFVNKFHGKIVNIHPSLLPKHKGLDTHQRAIDAGDSVHGATVHFVTADLDDGPIIIQKEVGVEPSDTAESLQKKVLSEEHKIYPIAIQWIATSQINFNQPTPL